jgi:excisionase family DNA binding protein
MMDKLLTPERAAEILGVKLRTMREWLRTGRIKGVKAGALWRIRENDLEAFLKEPNRPEAE